MTTPNALPARRVRLLGRDQDAANVRGLLATAAGRLVTILGPGGCGKTSLALEVAHDAIPALADDGHWVALDACHEPGSLPVAIASAIGALDNTGSSTTKALVSALRDRQALLVLDNCEHLRAAVAPVVDDLLSKCPDLRVLVTSRAPLNVRGEEIFQLQPLPVPAAGMPPAELAHVPSVALFLDRSRAAGQQPRPDEGAHLETVARICALVDGLPLAIELAAAQTLVFSPEQIVERLQARLPLPMRATMVGGERQQTMQAALNWSYDLLSEPQQRLLEVCGVFGGSWTLGALQAVARDVPDTALSLSRLVEHSLVSVVEWPGERRYRLLAPVREHAVHLLEESGRLAEFQDRHARYYLDLVERLARRAWAEPLTPLAVRELSADHENFLAALAHVEAAGETDFVRRFTGHLWVFWRITGRLHLGFERFQALLAMDPPSPMHRGLAYAGLANFAQLLGDEEAATRHGVMGLALYREAGSQPGQAMVLGMLAEVAAEAGDYEEARRRYGEVFAMFPDGSRNNWAVGLAQLGLGSAEYWDGNLDRAESLLRQGIERLGTRVSWHQGLAHVRFGSIARLRGALAEALKEGRYGLNLVDGHGGIQEVAHALEELAATEQEAGRFTRCATLLGAASNFRESTHSKPASAQASALEGVTARARRALGASAFTAAWVSGRALSRADAVAYALGESTVNEQPVAPLASLTSREIEVARLVSDGLSNAQIAAQLVISDATARTHVERIRSKLGVHSRGQIARVIRDAELEMSRP